MSGPKLLDFSDALRLLKYGHRMRFGGWAPHRYIYARAGSVDNPNGFGFYDQDGLAYWVTAGEMLADTGWSFFEANRASGGEGGTSSSEGQCAGSLAIAGVGRGGGGAGGMVIARSDILKDDWETLVWDREDGE